MTVSIGVPGVEIVGLPGVQEADATAVEVAVLSEDVVTSDDQVSYSNLMIAEADQGIYSNLTVAQFEMDDEL